MKVLVIQKKRIGDVLTSTVIFEAIKQKYPNSELHYLIYENAIAVVENNPFIDKIVVLNEITKKSKRKFIAFLFSIRKEKYNVVIDAYGKPNSVLIGWFSGAKIKVTFDKIYSKILYSHQIERHKTSFSNATKAIEHRLLMLQPIGIDFSEISPKIFLTELEIEEAKKSLEKIAIDFLKPIVMISAMGSSSWKSYPLHYMAKILDQIAEKEVQLLLNYIPSQKDEILQLFELCNSNTKSKIKLEFYESDLRKFLATTALCKALIGNEGGATNMSKALGVPTFSIFTPNVKRQDWSYFENETTIVTVHIDDYMVDDEKKEVEALYKIQNIPKIYEKFKPQLFEEKLNSFLNFNL